MATTGQQIFDIAVVLIDEMPETGVIAEAQVQEYQVRTPAILTLLEQELAFREGLDSPDIITSLSANLTISDRSARMCLPYGLAAHLLLEENPDSASYFEQKYEERKRKVPRSFVTVTNYYADYEETEDDE